MRLVADSACDIKELRGMVFKAVPLTISTDNEEFCDDGQLDIHRMLDILEKHKGRSYTACPGIDAWLEAFGDDDEIFVVTITAGMSGTYNSAMAARVVYLEEHPQAKVRVIDSKSTGPQMRIILEQLQQMIKEGKKFEEIDGAIDAYMQKTRLFCSLKSLHNLAQNGRVSKVVASAAEVLGISVIGTASSHGTLEAIGKCRGDKKLLVKLQALLDDAGYEGGKLRICHVENEALADKIADMIKQAYGATDVCVYKAGGLCSYYAERGGIILSCETK